MGNRTPSIGASGPLDTNVTFGSIVQNGNILTVTVKASNGFTGSRTYEGSVSVSGPDVSVITSSFTLTTGRVTGGRAQVQFDLNDAFPPDGRDFDVTIQAFLGADPILDSAETTRTMNALGDGGSGGGEEPAPPGPGGPGGGGGDPYVPSIAECDVSTTRTSLVVDWELDEEPPGSYSTDVAVVVDGQQVYSRSANLTFIGPYTEEIPLSDLPTGEDMPVDIEVGGSDFRCGTVTVEDSSGGGGGGGDEPVDPIDPPTVPELSDVTVDCPTLSPSEIQPGGTVTAEFTVSSSVDVSVNVDTALIVNGSEVETATVFVSAGSSSSDQYSVRLDEPGDYSISVEATGVN